MNHAAIIYHCRHLIKAVDAPSAGLNVWNEKAEAQWQKLRGLLMQGEPSRQHLAEAMRLLIDPVRSMLTETVKLGRFRPAPEIPGSEKGTFLQSQPAVELDAAVMRLSQAVADALHHVQQAEQEEPANAAG